MKYAAIFFQLFLLGLLAEPMPIQFSISESKMVREIPQKERDFAPLIPGDLSTYIYEMEEEYYRDYQRSYFAISGKKGGWDCMRHYEILANGCIPYFPNLDECDPRTMSFLPKELIKEAMQLEGVSYLSIDHSKFDKAKYYEILQKLLEHTRKHLTSRQMAIYLLKSVGYEGQGKILYLSEDIFPDYLRCTVLIGLKELLGERVVDYLKDMPIYQSYLGADEDLYGRGFSYARVIEDLPIDRTHIKERIQAKEFDLIIYGSIHRSAPFLDLVREIYDSREIVYLCGEDVHYCQYKNLPNLFLREFNR